MINYNNTRVNIILYIYYLYKSVDSIDNMFKWTESNIALVCVNYNL